MHTLTWEETHISVHATSHTDHIILQGPFLLHFTQIASDPASKAFAHLSFSSANSSCTSTCCSVSATRCGDVISRYCAVKIIGADGCYLGDRQLQHRWILLHCVHAVSHDCWPVTMAAQEVGGRSFLASNDRVAFFIAACFVIPNCVLTSVVDMLRRDSSCSTNVSASACAASLASFKSLASCLSCCILMACKGCMFRLWPVPHVTGPFGFEQEAFTRHGDQRHQVP